MTTLTVSAPNPIDAPAPIMLEPRHWLAALAMIFVLFAPYQTLVQTVITDDAIRLGVEANSYDMIWVNVAYLVGCIYGLFARLAARAHAPITSERRFSSFALNPFGRPAARSARRRSSISISCAVFAGRPRAPSGATCIGLCDLRREMSGRRGDFRLGRTAVIR